MSNHIPASEWARRVEAWKRSGLSAAEYGGRHGIEFRKLYWWSWWLGKKGGGRARAQTAAGAPAVRMLPVKVVPPTRPASEPRPCAAEFQLGHGGVLAIHDNADPDWAARLIVRVVREAESC
jgi:hypothetical protein